MNYVVYFIMNHLKFIVCDLCFRTNMGIPGPNKGRLWVHAHPITSGKTGSSTGSRETIVPVGQPVLINRY